MTLASIEPNSLVAELVRAGCQIDRRAAGLLEQVRRNQHAAGRAVLEVRSVAALGHPRGASLREVYLTAQSMGLTLCCPEAALRRIVHGGEWPDCPYLFVGMHPVVDHQRRAFILFVARGDAGVQVFANEVTEDFHFFRNYNFVLERKA